ncbi:IS66 family transposase [Leisingera sp. F5]|uniref:IS66 family transposase n=1 Tax=Leisingera sp. F5 TaxID=1813816 RepID=UPI000A86C382|nr:IS66 family transposase [Leisingera sp. F5]
MPEAATGIAGLRAALAASEARAEAAQTELAQVRAAVSTSEAMIKHLRLEIAKLRREQYGHSSERRARLIDQMEMQLEELETAAAEDETAAMRLTKAAAVAGFERRRPARKPFPNHLPRERVVVEAPTACSCCGSDRIVKMGEDIAETLEVIPRQWKVIQTVREKFTCRACEKISQPPAPFHPTPRGWAGPNLLAFAMGRERMAANGSLLFEKFGQHLPLNRQAERYAKEGVDLSLSTIAGQVGACTVALEPLHALIRTHVLEAKRLHGDDTTVPLLAKGGTKTARLWTYVRERAIGRHWFKPNGERPFGGGAPPAALFHFSRDRGMANPNRHLAGWQGILQAPLGSMAVPCACRAADAYGGYNDLYRAGRDPAPVSSAFAGGLEPVAPSPAHCWSHARRKFFELADIKGIIRRGKPVHDISPVALEAVARIDAVFDIERGINGLPTEERHAIRQRLSRPLVEALHDWMRTERDRMSKHNPVAKAISYMFIKDRWAAFSRFLDDGRICLTNNAAERALRGVSPGRKPWLFAGSERGGGRAAFMYSLIVTAKMNEADPQAWLADVLARLPGTTASRVPDLLPWNWPPAEKRIAA